MNKHIYITIFSLLFLACVSSRAQNKTSNNIENEELSLIDRVVQQLNLDKDQVSFSTASLLPNNSEEIIVVIPEIVNQEDDYYELNSTILIVDNSTGKIVHKYFESSKTNGWVSDAIFIYEIAIDTISYRLMPSKSAFGVIVKWRSNSQPNPYYNESISLFIKEKKGLKKVLDSYLIYESSGEVNVNMKTCYSNIKKTVNELYVSDSKTNNFYNILVKSTTTQVVHQEEKNEDCVSNEKLISIENKILQLANETYKIKQSFPENLNITEAKIDVVSINEIKRFKNENATSIYEYYQNEKVDIVEIWSDKMFGRCCSEADLDYSELLEFEINSNTENKKYPSSHLSDKAYRTAYAFKENQNVEISLKLKRNEETHKYHTKLLVDQVLKTNDTLLKPFKLSLVNGYVKSQKTFEENGRVKELELFLNNKYKGTIALLDTPFVQEFELDFLFAKDDMVVLKPLSYYKGTVYDNICISEIQSSLSKITHPSINEKYKVEELRNLGNAMKKAEK